MACILDNVIDRYQVSFVSQTKPDPEPTPICVLAVMKTTDSTVFSYRFARCSACAATIAAGVSFSEIDCGRVSPIGLSLD